MLNRLLAVWIIADQLNIQVLHKLVTYSKPSYNIRVIYWVNYNYKHASEIGNIWMMDLATRHIAIGFT